MCMNEHGMMAGLARLPVKDRDVLIFSNIESPKGRHHGTVWASFDGGTTWPIKRLVFGRATRATRCSAARLAKVGGATGPQPTWLRPWAAPSNDG